MSIDAARAILRTAADPKEVHHRDVGLALAFGRLHRAEPDGHWDRLAHRHLGPVATRIDPSTLGLHGGLAGIAFVLRYLGDGGRRYVNATAAAETLLLTATREHLAALPASAELCQQYDAISGLAGIGAVLLDIPAARPLLADLLDRLARWTAAGFHAGLYPNQDSVDLGLGHGIPGPLALFALAARAGVDCEEWVAHDLAEQLLSGLVSTEYGPDLPVTTPCATSAPSRIAWCYGNIGAARALQLAGDAFGEPTWTRAALELARSGIARLDDPAVSLITDSGLCHGTAGVLHVLTRISADAGDPADLVAVRDMLIERLSSEDLPDNPSLLSGTAGVALALLSTAGPIEGTDWDRTLLLS